MSLWCVTCLILGCSLAHLSPWAFLLPHLTYPTTQQEHFCTSWTSSRSPGSTSYAIKNLSGVKNCRVAEPPRTTTPTGYEPQRTWSKIILEIHTNCMVYRKIWRRWSPSSYRWRSGGIWKDRPAVRHPIADAIWQLSGKHCRFWSWRWRVTKNADFTSVLSTSNGDPRCNGNSGGRETGKWTNVSFIKRSESFG